MRVVGLLLLLQVRRLPRGHPRLQRPDPDPRIRPRVRDREVGGEDVELFRSAETFEGGLLRIRQHEGHRTLDFR